MLSMGIINKGQLGDGDVGDQNGQNRQKHLIVVSENLSPTHSVFNIRHQYRCNRQFLPVTSLRYRRPFLNCLKSLALCCHQYDFRQSSVQKSRICEEIHFLSKSVLQLTDEMLLLSYDQWSDLVSKLPQYLHFKIRQYV